MPSKRVDEDLKTLQADVAAFASSLGFPSAGGGTGFNDVDFRTQGSFIDDGLLENQSLNKTNTEVHAERKFAQSKSLNKTNTKVHAKRKFTESKSRDAKRRKVDSRAHKADKQPVGTSFEERKTTDSSNTQPGRKIEGNVSVNDCSKIFSRIWSFLKSGSWYDATAALLSKGEIKAASGTQPSKASQNDGPVEHTMIKPNATEDWNELVAGIRRKGHGLVEKATAHHEKSRGKDSDMRWLMMARRTGTTADKVAAFTVLIQDNPFANLKALDALLAMVTSKGGKRHAVVGIDALKELFGTSLLPDRKLKYLIQQPLQAMWDSQDKDILSLLWYWEDCLKQRYDQFVLALEEAAKDKLPFLKEKAIKTMYELLKAKPEQERKLLSAIVNKLGDPERKVASKAGYFLSCLLTEHPNMKMVVVEEVDFFVFRPHMELRSQYQAVVFLNQMVLSRKSEGRQLAKRLIDIYFSLFKVLTSGDLKDVFLKKRNQRKAEQQSDNRKLRDHGETVFGRDIAVEIDSRILSALLSGVNRAFPFVAADDVDALVDKHTPTLFHLVHSKSFNVGVQALLLLYQLLAKNNTSSDRLYRALYAVLFSQGLAKSSKVEMFFGLLFKAIKSDINSKRMAAFAKRLMQVALQQAPQFACGCLLLLSEILKSRPILWNAIIQPEDGDEETEHFHDIPDDLVTRLDAPEYSSKWDLNVKDVSIISTPRTEGSGAMAHSSDSDKEMHCTVPGLGDDDSSSADDQEGKPKEKNLKEMLLNEKISATQEIPMSSFSNSVNYDDKWPRKGLYDPRLREPSFCNADQSCWWELTALAMHVHPSVAAMAKTLLSGASILYAGDPLKDLALGVFLDRFAEKKPKSRRKGQIWHGSSLSAPARKASASTNLPVGIEFFQLLDQEVAPEDVVFHKFYSSKFRKRKEKLINNIGGNNKITKFDNGEEFLGGDNSDDDEVEDLLDQDEAMEVGLTESSEEDDWDGDLSFEQMSGAIQEVNGEVRVEDDNHERKPNTTLEASSDSSDFHTALNIEDQVRDHRTIFAMGTKKGLKEKRKFRKGKTANAFREESSKNSPFASADDYYYA